MTSPTPYLFFDGNCNDAMKFYQSCFGGTLKLMTYGEAPIEARENESCHGEQKAPPPDDAIMHACLSEGLANLMASDNPMSKPLQGDSIALSVDCLSASETKRCFEALSENGEVTMPLSNTFWGSFFGMVKDRYGFHWMISCPLEEQA